MIGDRSITIAEAFGVSLTGIVVVFLALIALFIAIKIISKIVGTAEGSASKSKNKAVSNTMKKSTAAPAPATKVDDGIDSTTLAAIIGAISMERRSKIDGFKIVSITEIK